MFSGEGVLLVWVHKDELLKLFKFQNAVAILIQGRHDSMQLKVLDGDSKLGEQSGQLVDGQVAALVLVKGAEHVAELIFLLLRVGQGNETLAHEAEEMHDTDVVHRGSWIFIDFPNLGHYLGERVIIRTLHRVVHHHLPELLLSDFATFFVSLGGSKAVKNHVC